MKRKCIFGLLTGTGIMIGLLYVVPYSAGTGVWISGVISSISAGVSIITTAFIDVV